MSLLPQNFSSSIVALGLEGSRGEVEFLATGFIYSQVNGKDEDGHDLYTNAFVTNRHVIEGLAGRQEQMIVRLSDPQSSTYNLSGQWNMHPDPEVDIAVAGFPLDDPHGNEHRVSSFKSESTTAFRENLLQMEFREGDEVYTLGFPLGLAEYDRNYPITRQGVVARIQDWYDGKSNSFLIDALIFPGNSGGPVIAKPTMFSYGQNRSQPKLIGVVSGYLPYEEIARSDQTGRPIVTLSENSGLATVVPIDKVKETILSALRI